MSQSLPLVSVIIPAPPEETEVLAVHAARQLDYPAEKLEIILARGRQPAVQRNAALRAARGELIYFVDNDALPLPSNLRRAAPHFEKPEVVIVGGPSICPADAPLLEQAFAGVMGNWLAFGPSRSRYLSIGKTRETSEKELILCNLLARRERLVQLGGFDEALYPNEENALMDALQSQGGKMRYDPELVAHRRPRRTWGAFLKMLRTYGRGRAEQFRLHPTFGSAANFVPPLFCLYLALTLLTLTPWLPVWALWPLALYGVVVLLAWLANLPEMKGKVAAWLLILPLIVLTHLFYGIGFWHGLFTRLKSPGKKTSIPVALENIHLA